MIALLLALLGWEVHEIDGLLVWTHVSGLVIYNQVPPC